MAAAVLTMVWGHDVDKMMVAVRAVKEAASNMLALR